MTTRTMSLGLLLVAAACGETESDPGGLRLRANIEPVRSVGEARSGVFIPPFLNCREPIAGETATRDDGQVCTHVSIAGATEPGRSFADYADCDVVRTQRPFWSADPYAVPDAEDPRLVDTNFMQELAWVTEQVEATGCSCCHSSSVIGGKAAQWDISIGPIWTDTVSDTGVALFTGLADSSVLGAYRAEDNNGFQRELTGLPSTDSERMKAFFVNELARRGITEAQAASVPPFGGPIYTNQVAVPGACEAGVGVDDESKVRWKGAAARYVYVMSEDAANPGVPPNFDSPAGTLWRLDVLASAAPISSGFEYGTTPAGSFQQTPETTEAPALVDGQRYHFTVLLDVGLPIVNCIFEAGSVSGTEVMPTSDAGVPDAAANSCTDPTTDVAFGTTCDDSTTHSQCGCSTNYCAVSPGQSEGYCTITGCVEDPSVCPSGWSCFDLSSIVPGQPSFCLQP